MRQLLGLILCLFLSACSLTPKETTIVIYSTNDTHAQIDSYAKVAAYLKSEREKHPNTLILSAGDMFSGNPVVDQHSEKGQPIVKLMNQAGYQYATFGNHEFDYGQENLQQRMNDAEFEMLCANMEVDTLNSLLKSPKPYTLFQIDDIKVGIIGLTEATENQTGELLPSAHPGRLKGLRFFNPIQSALKHKALRKECDLLLALTHIGHNYDTELAYAMPELDAIIGGHTHTHTDSTIIINGVLVTQAFAYLNYIGKTTITLQDKQVKDKKFELINVSKLKEEDKDIQQQIQQYYEKSPLNQVLAQAIKPFQGKMTLGNLTADAFRSIHSLDITFHNWGGIRIKELPKGNITMNDVFRLDPFGNSIIVYELTPSEIRGLLKKSYRPYNKQIDLVPSGLKYQIHTHEGKATKVTLTDMQGKPLDEKRRYKVGMNSYIASSYQFEHDLPATELPHTTSETLIEYLKKQESIQPQKSARGIITE